MSNEQEMVTITKKDSDRLLEDSCFLSALRGAGVDSWEGYDYAHKIYHGYA